VVPAQGNVAEINGNQSMAINQSISVTNVAAKKRCPSISVTRNQSYDHELQHNK
jgi:hypothetical protein